MGNTGSVHHSAIDGELNAAYCHRQRQQLQRQTAKNQELSKSYGNGARNWTKSLPHVYPAEANEREVFKVLPEVNEQPKLRTTTNGAILHSGGTISGRKEPRKLEGLPKAVPAMQRSQTFIYDTGSDDAAHSAVRPAFRRAQTQLYLNGGHGQTNRYSSPPEPKAASAASGLAAYSESDLRLDNPRNAGASLPDESAKSIKNGKKNKYNKKRKAPPAPALTPTFIANKPFNQMQKDSLTRTPRFRTLQQQKQQPQSAEEKPKNTALETPKLPVYRREKSFDVLLLRKDQSEPTKFDKKRVSAEYGDRRPHNDAGKLINDAAKPINDAAKPINDTAKPINDVRKAIYDPGKSISDVANVAKPIINATAAKPASKIPQLKRTFYFGMNSPAELQRKQQFEQQAPQQFPTAPKPPPKSPPISFFSDEKLAEKKLDDSGLLVNVRPTLPRRQLETPSFSPTVAWRMLVAEQQSLQPRRSCPKPLNSKFTSRKATRESFSLDDISGDSGIFADNGRELEPPIQLLPKIGSETPLRTHTSVWIPQQDLDDEDDDADKDNDDGHLALTGDNDDSSNELDNGALLFGGHDKATTKRLSNSANKNNSPSTAGVHLFSLSLPRDTHVQSHLKLAGNVYNNDKLPGFSSLQKLKSNVLNSKSNLLDAKGNSLLFAAANNSDGADSYYRSDNWVLHKNKIHQGAGKTSCGQIDGDSHTKWDVLNSIEPISLTYLAGGRHVMYLPGNDHNFPVAEDRTKPKTRKSAKPSASNMRESLQDKSPIVAPNNVYGHCVSQSNVELATSNEKSQRFSFQSTVRLLEKRRLAEKLSKDAEMREAQRKNEMEAMKRVEEDFQRKRAFEKANIRHQLRLYFNENLGEAEPNFEHISLPLMTPEKCDARDNNNNMFCRADPDGAVSTPSPLLPEGEALTLAFERRLPSRNDSDFGESDVDADDFASFKCTASLVEPYLQSFIK